VSSPFPSPESPATAARKNTFSWRRWLEILALLRIFVGGLAESVGAADLEALFASAGRVAGVEFVRTNGRSFAYVDFHCPNDKALAKLFSTVLTPTALLGSYLSISIAPRFCGLCLFM
jgi:hypothetical protein